jgi:hypothetical protein
MSLGPVEQRRDRARRLRHARSIVVEHELGHAPGRLEAVGRDREVDQRGRLAEGVDVGEVRQRRCERAKQEILPLERCEVLAVDSDQID